MALGYGFNITSSDMQQLLQKVDKQRSGVRTWRQLFGNSALGYNAQSDALLSDYSAVAAEAYKANLAQNDAIMHSQYNTGITQNLLRDNRNDLLNAYNTYIRNYTSDAGTLAQSYLTETDAIKKDLVTRAENFAALYNSAYDYLANELYGSTQTVPGTAANGAEVIHNNDGTLSYNPIVLDYMTDQGLDWALERDAQGELTGNLASWNTLSQDLFNTDGSLTVKGIQFFDQMFNSVPQDWTRTTKDGEVVKTKGFDEWLSSTNPKLREWWASSDAYNYNFAGTNKGTANVLAGRESTNKAYSPHSYATTEGANKLTIPSSDEFDKSLSDWSKKFNAYYSAYRTFKNTKYGANNTPEGQRYEAANRKYQTAEKAYDEIKTQVKTDWDTYINDINKEQKNLLSFLKEKVGADLYDEFLRENASLLNSYETLTTLNLLDTTPTTSDTEIRSYRNNFVNEYKAGATRVTQYYNDLYERVMAYINQHGYHKSSGF